MDLCGFFRVMFVKQSIMWETNSTRDLIITANMSVKQLKPVMAIPLSEEGVSNMKVMLHLFDVDTISNLQYTLKVKCAVHAWVR